MYEDSDQLVLAVKGFRGRISEIQVTLKDATLRLRDLSGDFEYIKSSTQDFRTLRTALEEQLETLARSDPRRNWWTCWRLLAIKLLLSLAIWRTMWVVAYLFSNKGMNYISASLEDHKKFFDMLRKDIQTSSKAFSSYQDALSTSVSFQCLHSPFDRRFHIFLCFHISYWLESNKP